MSDPDAKDQDPSLTADLLEIYFLSDRDGNEDLYKSTRASLGSRWESPIRIAELSSDQVDLNPAVSRDGLRIWFYSRREPPGIWHATRPGRDAAWSEPEPIPVEADDAGGVVIGPTLDELELRMAVSIGTGESRDIHEMVRPSLETNWSDPALIAGLNGDTADSTPFFIDDGLELLFSSGRSGAGDLFWASRPRLGLAIDRVEPLVDLNAPDAFESHPHLAADQSVVFFGSTRSGNTDIYQAVRR